jgi:hypothetical protein
MLATSPAFAAPATTPPAGVGAPRIEKPLATPFILDPAERA